jgi:tRNA threonylcarbamoyladenosine biosynthesis protein TsaE
MRVERSGSRVTVEVGSEEETEQLGRALAGLVEPGVVIGLMGPLGAGKTRLTRALAEALGVDPQAISSPTFVLIHEYAGRLPVYHFDTYRLAGPAEFEALGPWDYFEGEGVCLVEWADRVLNLLPDGAWRLRIEPTGATTRRVVLELPEGTPQAEALASRLARV